MNRMMQWFKFDHLPQHLQEPSKSCAALAETMDSTLPEGAEKTAGLRKLLEAKDCFVRAVIEGGTKAGVVLIALLVFALTDAAAAWQTRLAVNAGYVAQTTEDAAGEATEFQPTVLSGIQFYRYGSSLGLSVGAAALPDEEQTTPRVSPYGAIHFGTPSAQFYIGGAYDPQNGGGNDLVLTFGFTAAFGAP